LFTIGSIHQEAQAIKFNCSCNSSFTDCRCLLPIFKFNSLAAKTYIQNVILKFEGLVGKEFKPIKTPMSEGYHPEVYDSPLCNDDDSAKYISIIGCCIWIIVLGRFEIILRRTS
jgi:hypothetical protein